MVPMKEDPDSETFEMVQWPILLPFDFVFRRYHSIYFLLTVFSGFWYFVCTQKETMSIIFHFLVPFQASTLLSEGYISALVSDLRQLPEYWAGILKDFPGHPVKDEDPELRSSVGCTLYGFLNCKDHMVF